MTLVGGVMFVPSYIVRFALFVTSAGVTQGLVVRVWTLGFRGCGLQVW